MPGVFSCLLSLNYRGPKSPLLARPPSAGEAHDHFDQLNVEVR